MKRTPLILALVIVMVAGMSFAAGLEKFPFFPSLLNPRTGGVVPSSEYEDPGRCRMCHREIYSQWKGSMHSNAFIDPVFQALWRIGEEETDGEIRNLCAGCHSPIGTVGEEVSFDPKEGKFHAGEIAEKGIQCDFCHTVVASTWRDTPTSEPQNGSLLLDTFQDRSKGLMLDKGKP